MPNSINLKAYSKRLYDRAIKVDSDNAFSYIAFESDCLPLLEALQNEILHLDRQTPEPFNYCPWCGFDLRSIGVLP